MGRSRDGSFLQSLPKTFPQRLHPARRLPFTPPETFMTIKIVANSDKGAPAGKLADAELHFTEGPLEGLKLVGFSVWEKRSGQGRNVTFPARSFSAQGERRSFALLRPGPEGDSTSQGRLRDLILAAYEEHVAVLA